VDRALGSKEGHAEEKTHTKKDNTQEREKKKKRTQNAQGKSNARGQGKARRGKARQGKARQGEARRGDDKYCRGDTTTHPKGKEREEGRFLPPVILQQGNTKDWSGFASPGLSFLSEKRDGIYNFARAALSKSDAGP
jgi:hypothetical protein